MQSRNQNPRHAIFDVIFNYRRLEAVRQWRWMDVALDAEFGAGGFLFRERNLAITITSGMGSLADNTSGGSIAYRSSKAAVNMVMRSAAIDLAPRGITCVLVNPDGSGPIWAAPSAVVATGERDCHSTSHRDVRPKSIGQVL